MRIEKEMVKSANWRGRAVGAELVEPLGAIEVELGDGDGGSSADEAEMVGSCGQWVHNGQVGTV